MSGYNEARWQSKRHLLCILLLDVYAVDRHNDVVDRDASSCGCLPTWLDVGDEDAASALLRASLKAYAQVAQRDPDGRIWRELDRELVRRSCSWLSHLPGLGCDKWSPRHAVGCGLCSGAGPFLSLEQFLLRQRLLLLLRKHIGKCNVWQGSGKESGCTMLHELPATTGPQGACAGRAAAIHEQADGDTRE